MSIYIARSPYRSSMQARRRLNISFPNIKKLFQGGPKRTSVLRPQRPAQSARTAVTRQTYSAMRRPAVCLKMSASAGAAGAVRKVREAVLRFEFGPAAAIGGLFSVAIIISLLYLAHFNQVATKGYDLRRLEADRQQLMNQYDIKNMKLAEVKSLSSVIASDRVSAMRRPGEIIYVRGNTALASR